jgi:glycosyltransferase involved in cell wall biosynthesis
MEPTMKNKSEPEIPASLPSPLRDDLDDEAGQRAMQVVDARMEAYQLRLKVVQLNERIARLTRVAAQSAAQHQMQMEEMRRSSSWRITAPLRYAKDMLVGVRSMAGRVMRAVERDGGVATTVRRGLDMYRRSGVKGLRRAMGAAGHGGHDYETWVLRYDTIDPMRRDGWREAVMAMPVKPLISIVMPTYNPDPSWLTAAIESVQAQIYPHWELCIANDASPDPRCREVLDRLASQDRRIKVVHREKNGHISAASNSALEIATGEWIALMDHDDLLPEHALFWVADAIQRQPDVQLIYSDEDKIDGDGKRFGAYFKPDWNFDLFLSQNMFSHLGVYRADLMRAVGGFRLGMEGSQDYDLVLRCIERIRPDQIHHIPKVLYHWRVHAESTASSNDAKPYAQIAGARALNEYFQRNGVKGHVESLAHGYRVHYELPDPAPRVSLIIPTRNAMSLVRQCIESIERLTTYPNYDIIIVDNGSDDPAAIAYFAELASRQRFTVIRNDDEFNYSALNNLAVAHASGDIVGLVNNDIEVISPDWLSEMVSLALQPGVGAVGAKLWYPDHTLQHGGVILGVGGVASHAHKHLAHGHRGYFGRADLIQSFSAVTAACLVISKKNYEAVHGLDEVNLKVAFNDVDFCLRLREMGLRNVWTPYAELFHHESATRGEDLEPEKKLRFESEVAYMLERWGDLIGRDPAYHPNLTLQADDFSLAWPPIS